MRVPDETICKVCRAVFCCAECRYRHEIKNHAIVVRKPIMTPTENIKSNATESVNGSKASFDTTYIFCPICEKRPLILESDIHNEILLHIELHHLPLRCLKCFKMYHKINDLNQFSKCMLHNRELVLHQSCCADDSSKLTVTKGEMAQNSPLTSQDFNMTPISIINMRWKAKSKLTNEEFISDSVSSIKNISSISNSSIRRSSEKDSALKGKVIRCSSTPVQLETVFAKPKEQTFNATGGHMSSIQYNSGCDSDVSAAFSQPNSQALEPANRYMKVAGSRPRMSAVTPLRQVMSKSIQKALAEHGLPPPNSLKSFNNFHRKNMFDSISSPENNNEQSSLYPPLDLRLSPAVRRSQSESGEYTKNRISNNQQSEYSKLTNLRGEILLSSQKLTTESIVITRTEHLSSVSSSTSAVSSNYSINSVKPYSRSTNNSFQSAISNTTSSSIFKSCSSVEIITATREEIKQMQSVNEENVRNSVVPPLTPITRIPGSLINKKVIKFETPKTELCDKHETVNSPNDLFFTPNATPVHTNNGSDLAETNRKLLVKQNLNGRFSPQIRRPIREIGDSTAFNRLDNKENDFDKLQDSDDKDEVFLPQEPDTKSQNLDGFQKDNKAQPSTGLWSLMTSVMRLPSLKGRNFKESYKIEQPYSSVDSNQKSLIKRCASIAGSLVRSKSLVDENDISSLKRKRTYTTDNQSTLSYLSDFRNSKSTSPTEEINTSSKRFRIQGRRPIDRMRLNS